MRLTPPPHLPTTPERPLHAVSIFKLLREEEVQDRTQAREGQGQAERQSQLLPFEPESCDAVLNDWEEEAREKGV